MQREIETIYVSPRRGHITRKCNMLIQVNLHSSSCINTLFSFIHIKNGLEVFMVQTLTSIFIAQDFGMNFIFDII